MMKLVGYDTSEFLFRGIFIRNAVLNYVSEVDYETTTISNS